MSHFIQMVHLLNHNRHNCLKANPEKSHLLTNSAQEIQISICGMVTSSSKCEKLLGIHIDKKFTSEPHVRSLCKSQPGPKCFCARIECSLKFDQKKLFLNALITSQFSYTSVVWIFHNRKLSNNTNRIHERAFCISRP